MNFSQAIHFPECCQDIFDILDIFHHSFVKEKSYSKQE